MSAGGTWRLIRYGSVLVSEFINKIMLSGKKGTAERIFYEAASIIESKTGRIRWKPWSAR